jgi:hypothetical protein
LPGFSFLSLSLSLSLGQSQFFNVLFCFFLRCFSFASMAAVICDDAGEWRHQPANKTEVLPFAPAVFFFCRMNFAVDPWTE